MIFQSSENSGFTLLEVIVAMTLLATVGIATFSWINSSLESLYRVEQHSLKHRGSRTALAVLSSLNPMEHPTGEKQVGIFHISWEGHLVEAVQPGVNSLGRASLYELALYDVEVDVVSGDQLVAEFSVKQVGYRQVLEFTLGQ
jgi:general secretion pathway protein I